MQAGSAQATRRRLIFSQRSRALRVLRASGHVFLVGFFFRPPVEVPVAIFFNRAQEVVLVSATELLVFWPETVR